MLSGGRFLPGVGLGIADPPEQRAFGVERTERGRRHDEALDLMRKCWTGETISHRGEFYAVDDVQVLPVPVQDPLSVWLGRHGTGRAASHRPGGRRLAALVLLPRRRRRRASPSSRPRAAEHGRTMDPQHYGALVPYCDGEIPERLVSSCTAAAPGSDPRSVIPTRAGLPALLREFVDAGASKFVITPFAGDADPDAGARRAGRRAACRSTT